MTQLRELLDPEDLAREIEAGYVTERTHEDNPDLKILNYSDKCAFDRHWTRTTRLTRGLVYDQSTGEVLARAFTKFFNHNEPDAPTIDLDQQVRVVDKMDGSLGILYVAPDDEVAVATRGSFHSEQAAWATDWIRMQPVEVRDQIRYVMQNGFTPVVEIIYEENRIVLKYDTEGLVSLGMVKIDTGEVIPWDVPQIPAAEHFGDMTYREALAMEPRENAEGLVIQAGITSDQFVKIKQADYVALHRIVSSLTEKEVWRQLRDGTYDEYVVKLPDEFYNWATDVAERLKDDARTIETTAVMYFDQLPEGDQKTKAIWINQNVPQEFRGLVFSILNGKSLVPTITRMTEPKGI